MPRTLLPILLFLPLLAACEANSYDALLKPTGEQCRVSMNGGRFGFEAELLAMDDSALYLLRDRAVLRAPLAAVSSIEVPSFAPSHNKAAWNSMPGALLLGLSANFLYGNNAQPTFGTVLAVVGIYELVVAFLTSSQYSFSMPFSPDEKQRLKLLSRYQAGLTNAQWRTLLARHRQERFFAP
jgi:hypothetical protein